MQCKIKRENLIEALKLFDKCYLKAKKSDDEDFSEAGVLFQGERDKLTIMSNDTAKTAYFCFEDQVNLEAFEILATNGPVEYLAKGHDVSQLIKALKAVDDVYCILQIPDSMGYMTIKSDTLTFDVSQNGASTQSVRSTVTKAIQKPSSGFQVTFQRKQLKDLIASNDSTFVTLELPDHQQQVLGSNIGTIQGIVKVIHSDSDKGEISQRKINTLGTT